MLDAFLAVHNVYAAVTDVVAEHANWSTVPCMTFSVCVELVYSSVFRFLCLSTFNICILKLKRVLAKLLTGILADFSANCTPSATQRTRASRTMHRTRRMVV